MQMHRVMGIDIETYSPVDLAKAGVYAYAEAPAFDILLIGYKFDDETDVHVIDTLAADMASDEELRTLPLSRQHLTQTLSGCALRSGRVYPCRQSNGNAPW